MKIETRRIDEERLINRETVVATQFNGRTSFQQSRLVEVVEKRDTSLRKFPQTIMLFSFNATKLVTVSTFAFHYAVLNDT